MPDRVALVRTDLLAGLTGPFDVIVSNPPYVPDDELAAAQPEVRDFEPHLALAGGRDGLALVRRLVPEAAARLSPDGVLLVEFGAGQADAIRTLVDAEPRLALERILDDLAGIPRVFIARARR